MGKKQGQAQRTKGNAQVHKKNNFFQLKIAQICIFSQVAVQKQLKCFNNQL